MLPGANRQIHVVQHYTVAARHIRVAQLKERRFFAIAYFHRIETARF
jgi:hypothetical protein